MLSATARRCWRALLACALAPTASSALAADFGVRYRAQLEAFGALYPAAELSARNAQSRTDGYWPFVGRKEEPPIGLTYGEFPLPFFTALTDRACDLAGLGDERSGATFCDIGSGAGRLVLWAAATHAWRAALGVELLPGLCRAADAKLEAARDLAGLQLRTPRVELSEGSWDDASVVAWGEIDVAFAYTTAFPADEANVLQELTAALAPRLRKGCLVCTTDYRLGDGFELLEQLEGANDGVGGVSVGYVHRKTCEGAAGGGAPADAAAPAAEPVAARDVPLLARIANLEADVAERDAEIAALSEEVERLAAQLADGDREDTMLGSLQAWADAHDYAPEGGEEPA